MWKRLKTILAKSIYKGTLSINFLKYSKDSWLCRNLPRKHLRPCFSPDAKQIKKAIHETGNKGQLNLYEGYKDYKIKGVNYDNAKRNIYEVSIDEKTGNFFYWLVLKRKPSLIVEVGTAFGVSGMYFISGLKQTAKGILFTFEVNKEWACLAEKNLESIGSRFKLIAGKFEENFDQIQPQEKGIDIAFIDGIHVGEVVDKQIEILKKNMHNESLIILDDINFSSDMKSYWENLAVSRGKEIKAIVEIHSRIGIIELSQ